MKFVLLGTLSQEWATKHSQRVTKARAKLEQLGIRLDAVLYTQGQFDFVDVIEAPNAEAVLAFSIWYMAEGLGRLQSLPAFDSSGLETAVKKAIG